MNFEWISLDLIIEAALGFLSVVLTIIFSVVSYKSGKRKYILQLLPTLIKQANEALGSKTGSAKLQYVLSIVSQLCDQFNLKYSSSYYTAEIENILSADKAKKEVSCEKNESSSRQRPSYFFKDGK